MKVLGNLLVPKDSNSRYPFGSNIKNETDTEQGTPVVREIYGDPLMNLLSSPLFSKASDCSILSSP